MLPATVRTGTCVALLLAGMALAAMTVRAVGPLHAGPRPDFGPPPLPPFAMGLPPSPPDIPYGAPPPPTPPTAEQHSAIRSIRDGFAARFAALRPAAPEAVRRVGGPGSRVDPRHPRPGGNRPQRPRPARGDRQAAGPGHRDAPAHHQGDRHPHSPSRSAAPTAGPAGQRPCGFAVRHLVTPPCGAMTPDTAKARRPDGRGAAPQVPPACPPGTAPAPFRAVPHGDHVFVIPELFRLPSHAAPPILASIPPGGAFPAYSATLGHRRNRPAHRAPEGANKCPRSGRRHGRHGNAMLLAPTTYAGTA